MRYWSVVLCCLALNAPRPGLSRVCQDLRTGPDSFNFARDAYNCTQLLADHQYTLPMPNFPGCPPGYHGTACQTPCPTAYSLVLNADDPRRCGGYAPGGCTRAPPTPRCHQHAGSGIALIPDDATQAGRIVFATNKLQPRGALHAQNRRRLCP